MNFTKEHIRILEKNKHYFESLQQSGTLTKISSVIVDEFKTVYKEAISEIKVNVYCSACIVELIELVYINYEKYLQDERKIKTTARPKPTRK
jgi:predicted transcriptional regulator